MTTVAAELLRDEALLPALAPEWAALWRRSGASPFQHPAWLLPWWAQFGNGAPRVALLRGDDGRLLGLLPLYDLVAERKVLPMGAGLSDYHDAVIDPGAPPDAVDALLRTALAGCDLPCHLTDLPSGAMLRAALAPRGWTASAFASDPCPVLRPQDVPARQRRKLRMSRHRAERIGGYAVCDAPFADLVRLHEQRWRGSGVLADRRVRAFHAAALTLLAEAGLLRLRALRFGDATAAVIYALQSPGRLFFYLSGFDDAHSFQSPGTILLGAMIDEAAEAGVTELHFLRGAESYKYAWGAQDRCNATRILEPA